MKKLALSTVVLSAIICLVFVSSKSDYKPRTDHRSPLEQVKGSIEYFNKIRANQITGRVDLIDVERARTAINAMAQNRQSATVNLTWDEMGPDNIGGRTRALMLDKDSSDVIYAGGVAGGLWKSTNGGLSWKVLFDRFESNTVSCITQAVNGDIYVGTGEGHYSLGAFGGSGAGGMIGSGIWKSTNRGASWTRLASTIPTVLNSYNAAFAFVNEVDASPTNPNRIYASTNNGVRMSDDGGNSWINPIHTAEAGQTSGDVHVTVDGTVFATIDGHAYRSPNGDDNTFVLISSVAAGKLPNSGASRIEFASSVQDPNYIYACVADDNGALLGVYQSINKGNFWTNIASASANPLGNQGTYDNTIAVSTTNKNRIFVGGQSFYSCNVSASPLPYWNRIGDVAGSYVHSDNHALVFHPTDGNILYVGNDGGLYKTTNALTNSADGPIFNNLNNGYNVTQFYAISPTASGGIVGGCQDNGSKYIDTQGGFNMSASTIGGGDGGYTEASFILPTTFFSTVYYGALARTFGASGFGSSFYSPRIEGLPNFGNPGFASFVTPIALWESFYDKSTSDSINYTIKPTDPLNIGGVLQVRSQVTGFNSLDARYLYDTNSVTRTVGETIRVKDYLQSHLAVGFNNSVWFTKDAINESGPVRWLRIGADLGVTNPLRYFGEARILRFSADGDYLYVGTFSGNLFRFSNLKSILRSDTLTGEIGHPMCQIDCKKIATFSGRAICGIAVDPNNNDKVVITLGNYGNNNYVYLTNNATASTPAFSLIQNNLPQMPVYDALIDMYNPNIILLGTEYGVWASDDNGATWGQSQNFPYVPTLCLRQQLYPYSSTVSHTGVVFAATHGRGVFKSSSLVSVKDKFHAKEESKLSLQISPNPVRDEARLKFNSGKSEKGELLIYAMNGKLIRRTEKLDITAGENVLPFSVADFEAGTYFVSLRFSGKQLSTKFVVIN